MEELNITINGRAQKVKASHLAALIFDLNLNDRPVAIALNDSVIPSSEFAATPLHEGDRIEIVQAVCGG